MPKIVWACPISDIKNELVVAALWQLKAAQYMPALRMFADVVIVYAALGAVGFTVPASRIKLLGFPSTSPYIPSLTIAEPEKVELVKHEILSIIKLDGIKIGL